MVGFSTKWHWPILIEGIWYYCNDALAPSQAAQKKDGTQSTKEGCRAPIVMTDCARLPGDWIACGGTRRFWLDQVAVLLPSRRRAPLAQGRIGGTDHFPPFGKPSRDILRAQGRNSAGHPVSEA